MRVLISWVPQILAEAVLLPLYFQVAKSNTWFCCENVLLIPYVYGFDAGKLLLALFGSWQKFPLEENVTVLYGYYLDLPLAIYCSEQFVLMCEEQWLVSLGHKVSRQLLPAWEWVMDLTLACCDFCQLMDFLKIQLSSMWPYSEYKIICPNFI